MRPGLVGACTWRRSLSDSLVMVVARPDEEIMSVQSRK